jgi:hypothetical protein
MSKTESKSRRTRIPKGRYNAGNNRDRFLKRLARISDGSVYTRKRLLQILGMSRYSLDAFIRMCEVYPGVVMNVTTPPGVNGNGQDKWQFQFTRVEANERVIGLAKEIIDDPTAGLNAKHAAEQIITFLGA